MAQGETDDTGAFTKGGRCKKHEGGKHHTELADHPALLYAELIQSSAARQVFTRAWNEDDPGEVAKRALLFAEAKLLEGIEEGKLTQGEMLKHAHNVAQCARAVAQTRQIMVEVRKASRGNDESGLTIVNLVGDPKATPGGIGIRPATEDEIRRANLDGEAAPGGERPEE